MRTIKRKVIKVKCPVCKSLIEIKPEELKIAQLDEYLEDEYLSTKIFKAFCCPECSRAIYYRGFHWREWTYS